MPDERAAVDFVREQMPAFCFLQDSANNVQFAIDRGIRDSFGFPFPHIGENPVWRSGTLGAPPNLDSPPLHAPVLFECSAGRVRNAILQKSFCSLRKGSRANSCFVERTYPPSRPQ